MTTPRNKIAEARVAVAKQKTDWIRGDYKEFLKMVDRQPGKTVEEKRRLAVKIWNEQHPPKKKRRRGSKPKQYDKNAYVAFYQSREWLDLRFSILLLLGRRCCACGTTSASLHIDHILPRSKSRNLELNANNLQVLCRECNKGKSNHTVADFRTEEQKEMVRRAIASGTIRGHREATGR